MDGKSMKYERMLKLASCVLRKTGEKIAELQKDNEKLSCEILHLKRSMEDADRFEETMKLATKMHDKGLIKQADIEAKAREMMGFDENALKVVELSLSGEDKIASEGVSSLSDFYIDKSAEEDPMMPILRQNMADIIQQMADDLD